MITDSTFGIPPSALVRFLSITNEGAAELHEQPAGIAQAIAETLRAGGMRICWYPEPVTARQRRAERKAARRQVLV